MMTSIVASTARRGLLRGCLRRATRGLLRMSDTGLVLAGAVAVIDAFGSRQKRLPGDAGRIVDPGLFRCCVAASGLALLNHVAACGTQTGIYLLQFRIVFGLNT